MERRCPAPRPATRRIITPARSSGLDRKQASARLPSGWHEREPTSDRARARAPEAPPPRKERPESGPFPTQSTSRGGRTISAVGRVAGSRDRRSAHAGIVGRPGSEGRRPERRTCRLRWSGHLGRSKGCGRLPANPGDSRRDVIGFQVSLLEDGEFLGPVPRGDRRGRRGGPGLGPITWPGRSRITSRLPPPISAIEPPTCATCASAWRWRSSDDGHRDALPERCIVVTDELTPSGFSRARSEPCRRGGDVRRKPRQPRGDACAGLPRADAGAARVPPGGADGRDGNRGGRRSGVSRARTSARDAGTLPASNRGTPSARPRGGEARVTAGAHARRHAGPGASERRRSGGTCGCRSVALRRHRPHPYGVPLPRCDRSARRGDAARLLPPARRVGARTAGDGAHARCGRRQADPRAHDGRRVESLSRTAGGAAVPLRGRRSSRLSSGRWPGPRPAER